MAETSELRLKWRKTWPDRENDFAAFSPRVKHGVGRIYLHNSGPHPFWFWTMHATVANFHGNKAGSAEDARAAAASVEAQWFKMEAMLRDRGLLPAVTEDGQQ